MKFVLFLCAALSAQLTAAPALTTDGAYELNKRSAVDRKYSTGTKLYDSQQFGVKATWDYSLHGGASGDLELKDHEGNKVTLPAGAIIRDCMIDVVTQPTSSTSSGRIAFSSNAVGDLKAAALAHTGYLASTGEYACIPDGTVANVIQPSSEVTLKMRIHSEALTAGKINIWVEYVLSE